MTEPAPLLRILAATDLRLESDEVIRQALAIAKAEPGRACRVAVCHVLPELRVVRALFPQLHAEDALAAAEIEAFAREELHAALERLGNPEVDVFFEVGSPNVRLVERAKAWRADLVVIGAPTSSPRSSRTAEGVIRHAPIPVLVARSSGQGPVVVGSDLSEPSLRAVLFARDQARALGKGLVAVHAVDASRELGWLSALRRFSATARETFTERLGAKIDEASAQLKAVLAPVAPAAHVDVQIGEAAAVIARRAADLDASLIVVATQGRTGLDYALVGSVAEGVIERANCSVLVVRDRAE